MGDANPADASGTADGERRGASLLFLGLDEQEQAALRAVFEPDYAIVAASDMDTALAAGNDGSIEAILYSPALPGCRSLLRRLDGDRRMPLFAVASAQDDGAPALALESGADDVILLPSDVPFARARMRNALESRCSSFDPLTGLYREKAFEREAAARIAAAPAGTYLLACCDVDNFKAINSQYGRATGDFALQQMGRVVEDFASAYGGIACRVSADNFELLLPAATPALLPELAATLEEAFKSRSVHLKLQLSIGRYVIDDKRLAFSEMTNNALLAKRSIKGRYNVPVAYFDDEMRRASIEEQRIISLMDYALAEGQFEVWLQPQYDHGTGAMTGAEALVRWRDPERDEMVPPGAFVPVFERNGFIYELDAYVWERVCELLRLRLDEGKDPLPISVNVSRIDLLQSDFYERITALTESYGVPESLLRLEITESAFSSDTARIIDVVRRLRERGFTIEIDDFGSGYSSFSVLKDVPADVLKLDMLFLSGDDAAGRGGAIVESVVRMAKRIGVQVVAEGVETREQADYLRSIGCPVMQGYFYDRPLPLHDFEERVEGARVAESPENGYEQRRASEQLLFVNEIARSLLADADADDAIRQALEKVREHFGGTRAYVFEFDDEKRASRATYASCAPGTRCEQAGPHGIPHERRGSLMEEFRRGRAVRIDGVGALPAEAEEQRAVLGRRGAESALFAPLRTDGGLVGYVEVDDPQINGRCVDQLAAVGDCIAATLARRDRTARLQRDNELTQRLMNDTPGGFVRLRMLPGGNAVPEFISDGFCRIMGMTHDEAMELYTKDAYAGVHPDDVLELMRAAAQAMEEDDMFSARARFLHKERGYVQFQAFYRTMTEPDGTQFTNGYYVDMTAEVEQEERRKELLESLRAAERRARETNEQLRLLSDVSRYLLVGDDPHDAIRSALRETMAYFDGDRAYLFELDEGHRISHNTYEVCAPGVEGEKDRLQSVPFSEQEHTLGLLAEGENLWIDDTEGIADLGIADGGVRSFVLMPLINAGKLAGFMGVDNPRRNTGHVGHLAGLGDSVSAILQRRDNEEQILRDNRVLRDLMNDMPGGFVQQLVSPDGRTVPIFINEEFCRMSGMTHEECVAYYSTDGFTGVHPDDNEMAKRALENLIATRETLTLRLRLIRGDGSYVPMQVFYRVTDDRDGNLLLSGYYTDLTDQLAAEEREMAEHDELTGLSNRTKLANMMAEYRGLSSCGVLFFDVNHLKTVNDTEGHQQGDVLLRLVADGIASIVGERVHGYRYGGDEFLVVACDGEERELDELVERWKARMRELADEHRVTATAAVGCAWSEAPFALSDLIRRADTAMYADKQRVKRLST